MLEHKPDEQLNTTASGPGKDFTLDEIMAEFGSAAPPPPPAEEEEDVRIWQPRGREEPAEPEPAPEPEEAEAEEAVPEKQRLFPRRKPKAPSAEDVPEESDEDENDFWEGTPPPRLRLLPRLRRFDPEDEDEIASPPEPPTPEEALEEYRRRFRRLRPMTIISWSLMLLTLGAVAVSLSPWSFAQYLPVPLCNKITLAVLLVQCILALDPLSRGIREMIRGRFTVPGMLVLTAAVAAVQGFTTLHDTTTSFSMVAAFLVTLGLWGEYLQVSAKLRTLVLVMHMENPKAAARFPQVWKEKDGLCRVEADLSRLTRDLESRSAGEKAVDTTALILTAASLAVAGLLSLRGGADFLWAWTLLLLGACPIGGVLAFSRTFCLASKYLKSCGAALAGYDGALRLCGEAAVVLTDDDLFSRQHLSLNGIKVFGDFSAERLLGYAVALLQRSGAKSLSRTFDEVLTEQNGPHYRTGDFRTYEAGGLGGQVQNDVVLLGGLGFMDLMGVQVPSDTRLKQALYISVNGVAEGVFAISYHPSDAVRSGLSALLSCGKIEPVLATQDPLITPALVKLKYGLPGDFLEYPTGKDRAALATAAEGEGEQGAYLSRDSFLSFSVAVAVGRQLRLSVSLAFALSVLASVIGFLLLTVMAVVEARAAADSLTLLAYHLIWLVPVGLLTRRIRK